MWERPTFYFSFWSLEASIPSIPQYIWRDTPQDYGQNNIFHFNGHIQKVIWPIGDLFYENTKTMHHFRSNVLYKPYLFVFVKLVLVFKLLNIYIYIYIYYLDGLFWKHFKVTFVVEIKPVCYNLQFPWRFIESFGFVALIKLMLIQLKTCRLRITQGITFHNVVLQNTKT